MKKILSILLFLPLFLQAQIKVKNLPDKTSNFLQGDNLIIDDSAGAAGATKKISVGSLKTNYGFITGSSAVLTTGFIPKATGSATIGNSTLFTNGTHFKIPNFTKIYGGSIGSNSFLTFDDGTQVTLNSGTGFNNSSVIAGDYGGLLIFSNALVTSQAQVTSTQAAFDYDNGAGATGSISASGTESKISHSSLIKLNSPTINIAQGGANKLLSLNGGKNLTSVYLGGGLNLTDSTLTATGTTNPTSTFIPYNNAGTVADSWFSQDANSVFLANSKLLSSVNGQSYINFQSGSLFSCGFSNNSSPFGAGNMTADDNQIGIYHNQGVSPFESGSIIIQNDANKRILLNHTTRITFDAPAYRFANLTSNTITYLNNNLDMVSLANGAGVLTNNGSGALSWVAPSAGTVTSIATTSPITGGTITSTGTIGINNSAADGTTKGAASFTASDFDATSGNISIDYTNAQKATGSIPGLLTAADWTTFNNKGSGTVTSVSGTANQIASTGGATPVISIVTNPILPGAPTIVSPGNSTQNIITTDATQTLSNKTFVAPALGTPASGVATNLTGTAAGLTAGNVTTNANLTGHITSVGNAAVLGSFTSSNLSTALTDETGSGSAVFGTSPTFTTNIFSPVVTGGTGTTSTLAFRTTTGVGTTGADMAFQVGNNGGTEAMRIINSGFVGINKSVPTSPFHIGGTAGANGGMTLELLANSGTAASSYSGIDFYIPTTGLSGQFFSTATNYNASNSLNANSIGLAAEATSGQLWLAAIGSSGVIDFVTGGAATSNLSMRIGSKGQISLTPQISTTGAVTNFTYTAATNTGQTTGSEINGILWTTGIRQWAGSTTVATQREFYITTPSYRSASATKTITDAFTFYADAGPTASTNTAITRSWSAGFNGRVGIATNLYIGGLTTAATALIHFGAGTATASTAPLKFTTGTNLTSAEAGAMEYSSNVLYFTPNSARYQVSMVLPGSATLDFPSTLAGTVSELTITVTGAADGDAVEVGVPNASMPATGTFEAYVSSSNTVTVRYANNSLTLAQDPASGTFKVTVNKN